MQEILIPLALTVATSMSTGALTWLFSLSSRMASYDEKFRSADTRHEDLKELIVARFDGLDEKFEARFNAGDRRLDRIERSMNGHLIKHD